MGPKTYVCLSGNKVVFGPEKFVTVPPQHYVTVANPVVLDKTGHVIFDKNGQATLQHGDIEVRTERDPFPLYPGERLDHAVRPLPTIAVNAAVRLEAIRDVVDDRGKIIHKVGEEWLEIGPKVIIPHPSTRIVANVNHMLIGPNEALHMRANRDLVDIQGKKRIAGEEYMVKVLGAYLPQLDEVVVSKVNALVLTPKVALLMQAKVGFKDQFGKDRKVGDQWLVTSEDTESFIPGVEETHVQTLMITTLTARSYCIVSDPIDPATGKNRFGEREIRRGPQTFFLQPGERMEMEPAPVCVLKEDDAVEYIALEQFEDEVEPGKKVVRKPGEVWRLVGPREYWQPLQALHRSSFHPLFRIPALGLTIWNRQHFVSLVSILIAVFLAFFVFTRLL